MTLPLASKLNTSECDSLKAFSRNVILIPFSCACRSPSSLAIPALLNAMHDTESVRVRVHGGAAMVNFSENADKELLVPYLDQVCGEL